MFTIWPYSASRREKKDLSRRNFLEAASGAAAVGLLAACAPVSSPASDSSDMEGDAPDEMVAELEMWTEMATVPWLGAMDEIVERFNGANPGIQVTHSGFSGLAYGKATKTAFAGGAVPDCLQTDAGPGVRSAFIEADQLDLTAFVEASKGAIYPDALDSVYYQGKYWGAPWAMTVANLMYYNEDILNEHGIDPATLTIWSAFTAACESLKGAGVTSVLIGAKNACPCGHWAHSTSLSGLSASKARSICSWAAALRLPIAFLNSPLSVILTYMSWSSPAIIFIRAYFMSTPPELKDGARVDGAREF